MKFKPVKYLKYRIKVRYRELSSTLTNTEVAVTIGERGLNIQIGYDWRKGFEYSNRNEYVDDIKSVAQYYGYDSDEIDCLLNNGFTPEEVEEMLYADDFLEV